MTIRTALFSLLMILLTSCHQTVTTQSLCQGHEAVVVDLEGRYLLNMFGETNPVKFKKTNEVGRYALLVEDDKIVVSTCIVNDNIYFSPDIDPTDPDETHQLFKVEFITLHKILITGVALDQSILKSKSIPFSRYEDDGEYMDMVITEIDNANLTAEEILSAEIKNAQTFNAVLTRL